MNSPNKTSTDAAGTSNGEGGRDGSPEDDQVSNQNDVVHKPDQLPVSVSKVALALEQLLVETKENITKDLSEEAACASTSNPQKQNTTNFVYSLKWITWHDNKTPIVTQNENGPCPLIAIVNVLLLSKKIEIPPHIENITSDRLIEYIVDTIFENIPKNISGTERLDYEQNVNDVMAILPRLQTGLDVNIQFTGVQDFEYTPECIIFDLLNISLYHGWLVDPQAHDIVSAIGDFGYNQLLEKIIANKCSRDVELATEALIAEEFLKKTASQLTVHGLCVLNATMRKNELAILFRNNHFITILKKGDQLYQLVTDQGFLRESRVVWETLSNIEGDETFVDANFVKVPPKSPEAYKNLPSKMSQEKQINQDEELARQIQEEEKKKLKSPTVASSRVPSNQVHSPDSSVQSLSDERMRHCSCIIQ